MLFNVSLISSYVYRYKWSERRKLINEQQRNKENDGERGSRRGRGRIRDRGTGRGRGRGGRMYIGRGRDGRNAINIERGRGRGRHNSKTIILNIF